MLKKRFLTMFLAAASLFTLCACAGAPTQESQSEPASEAPSSETPAVSSEVSEPENWLDALTSEPFSIFDFSEGKDMYGDKTINIIGKASPNQHIAIICETPQDVLKLVEGGVPIKKVNIGNMHMADGKRQVATSVAVNDDDVACFRKLQELGVELEIKRVPDTPAENIEKLFK